jgi:hypothetical protein
MLSNTYNITANGKQFRVKETIMKYGDRILSHTFKLGGDYDDCVNVTLFYENDQPIHGKIPYIEHDEKCAIGSTLDRGSGTILMIKTLLRHIHKKYPAVTRFKFDDMSHIECDQQFAVEQRFQKKRGTKNKPMNLYHFSIAYNNQTWYERYFGAEMDDPEMYQRYRARVEELDNPTSKPDFVQFINMTHPPMDQYAYLEKIYVPSRTYREFFQQIPKADQCPILYPWIDQFMDNFLGNTFRNKGWVIDVTRFQRGGNRRGHKGTRKNGGYYLPAGKIVPYTEKHFVGNIDDIL